MSLFNQEASRRITEAVHAIESSRPQAQRPQPPRVVTPPRNAVTRGAITARSGMQKGSGYVDILCDKGDGSGKDYVIQSNVKIWNPYTDAITKAGVYVSLVIKDGLIQLDNSSCFS